MPTPKSGFSRRVENAQSNRTEHPFPEPPSFKKKSDKKLEAIVEKKILKRIVKVSQLSYGLTSSEEPADVEVFERKSENTEESLMNKAATLIKSYWREYKKTKVVAFYKQIFSRNALERERIRTIESYDSNNAGESYAMDSEGLQKLEELFESSSAKGVEKLDWQKHHKSESGNIEEEDSQFNIRKY